MASKPAIPSAPTAAGPPSTSRRQPMRQARTTRKNASNSKLGRGTTNGVNGQSTPSNAPPAKFYPALSQFTDAIDALPSETIRHFTLLREVDAKACGPETNLRALIESAQSLPPPEDPYEVDPAIEALKTLEGLQQRRDDFTADAGQLETLHHLETTQASEGPGSKTILGHPETRRARCAQIRAQIADLLKTQDEKIHVITTANEALQKHLQRIEHTFGYVQMEIPDTYRLGSTEHWAYKDPVKKGTLAAQARAAEKAQKEAEERHNQQQQREIETSNTRSETRREALARQKAAAAAAAAAAALNDEEEQSTREQNSQQTQPVKKLHGNSKIRKEQEALASAKRMAEHQSATGTGGMVPASSPAVPPQQPKRRKTTNNNNTKEGPGPATVPNAIAGDKPPTVEPAIKAMSSPRIGTPSAGSKRGGKSGTAAGGGRGGRSRHPGGPAASPNLASSPTHSVFPTSAGLGKEVTSTTTGKTSDKQLDNNLFPRPPEPAKPFSGSKAGKKDKDKDKDKDKEKEVEKGIGKDESKRASGGAPGKEGKLTISTPDTLALAGKPAEDVRDVASEDVTMSGTSEKPPMFPPAELGASKNSSMVSEPSEKPNKKKKEAVGADITEEGSRPEELPRKDSERRHSEAGEKEKKRKRVAHDDHDNVPSSAPPTVTEEKNKSHQAPSSSSVKARPSTSDGVPTAAAQTPSSNKRQQRKRADSSAAAMSSAKLKVEEPEEEPPAAEDDADADAEEDADEDEPVYCYCQQISYGEMVACDGENCPREWFHLACVGLSQAPRGKTKWYCSDCKEGMTRGRRLGSKA
ncbi:hypothetical protein HOY82DRAFT_668243 [Tuber indicum]|nr:hypothetical protein HOY82DRAFT_668243 [Tuber indicum]